MDDTGCRWRGQDTGGGHFCKERCNFPTPSTFPDESSLVEGSCQSQSHAQWPFLTKMFMHSYDLIEATLKKQEENHEEKDMGNITI